MAKRGRPKLADPTTPILIRMPASLIARLDRYRAKRNRSEAIRGILDTNLPFIDPSAASNYPSVAKPKSRYPEKTH